jgi:O-antigen ligase
LAVFLVFAVVRNNLASPSAFRRLAVLALANGALLSLFALIQFFTSPPTVLYWTYESTNPVFGPFICHNHFPFYVNLCLGLGLGLILVSRPYSTGGLKELGRGNGRVTRNEALLPRLSPLALLQEPQVLWASGAAALILAGVALSQSRGGYLALSGAALVCLMLTLIRSPRLRGGAAAILIVALAAGLVAWLGFAKVQARVRTIGGSALQKSRLPIWSDVLPLVRDFPVWGSGYGTFAYVEPLHRAPSTEDEVLYEHAHNEYLEALVEGGFLRLVLSVLAIGLVYWFGYRALVRFEGHPAAGLALGGLFAFSALAIHSAGDFGLHIPAIALLATVLCAQLCALGDKERLSERAEPATYQADLPGKSYQLRLGGLGPALGALTAVILGLLLTSQGWRESRVQHYRRAAFRLASEPTPRNRDRQLALLETAARLAPEFARLRVELAQAHLDAFEEQTKELERSFLIGDVLQGLLAAAQTAVVAAPSQAALSATLSCTLVGVGRNTVLATQEDRLARDQLVPALRHFLHARDACPVMSKPHVRLAANADRLARADPRSAYLERAKLLVPADPELWYVCGIEELFDGQPEAALASWRRSLELSNTYLTVILDRSIKLVGARGVVEEVLPDKADMWWPLRSISSRSPNAGRSGRLS